MEDENVRNWTQVAKYTQKAAENGYARAQYALGNLYSKGEGVPYDTSKSFYWFLQAAQQGYAVAQCQVGRHHYHGDAGLDKDDECFAWYKKAAYQGDLCAQYCLG